MPFIRAMPIDMVTVFQSESLTRSKPKYPVRILHVLGGMNRGGAETWLMHVLRNIDRENFQFDFLVHTTDPCDYDEEIRELGSRVIPCMHPWKPWQYAINFRRILKRHGPYDVVHSHVHHYSGFVLRISQKAGIPVRIAHSHSDTAIVDSSAWFFRKIYLRIMSHFIKRYATIGLSASEKAAISLFGSAWENNLYWRILHCGLDFSPFSEKVIPSDVRFELGLKPDTFVVGHVGRFVKPKNHTFLVEIAAELIALQPNTQFLLIGDGPLRPAIETQVDRFGLKSHFIFTGLRADVHRLMLGAMDVLVLPSRYEGLPLVLIEAQSAHLPCFFSDGISQETVIFPYLCNRLSLEKSASDWAQRILKNFKARLEDKEKVLAIMNRSSFNIIRSVKKLVEIYAAYPNQ